MTMIRTALALAATVLLTPGVGAEEPHPHHFAPDVNAFHAVLAPVWHAPAGEMRLKQACAKAPRLETLARRIRSTDAKALLAATTRMKAQCRTAPTLVEPRLGEVHDAFHDLIGHKPQA